MGALRSQGRGFPGVMAEAPYLKLQTPDNPQTQAPNRATHYRKEPADALPLELKRAFTELGAWKVGELVLDGNAADDKP